MKLCGSTIFQYYLINLWFSWRILWIIKKFYALKLIKIILPRWWHNVSETLVWINLSLRFRILKSNWIMFVRALFRLSRSAFGLICVSMISVLVAVQPYEFMLIFISCEINHSYPETDSITRRVRTTVQLDTPCCYHQQS